MSAHQPNFLPYLGFFDKMLKSDIFVIRDEVQFVEKDFHHRNKIRIKNNKDQKPQSKWIRVPVKKEIRHLRKIEIKKNVRDKNVPWNLNMSRQIKGNYQGTPFFERYYSEFEKLILHDDNNKLVDYNMKIIRYLKDSFNINTEIVFASELGYNKTGRATEDLIRIAKAVGTEIYLSGIGGKGYLDQKLFYKEKVELRFQRFNHPVYHQGGDGFLPNLAAIDALFNAGNVFNKKFADKNNATCSSQIKLA